MTAKETKAFDGAAFKAWRVMVGLSQVEAGNVLGYERRAIQQFERERLPLRNCLALACCAYALGVRSYAGPDAKARMEGKKR